MTNSLHYGRYYVKMEDMKICYTGGGTLGHIYPAIAINETLVERIDNVDCYWIGRNNFEEKAIVEYNNIRYFSINSGKFRRYFSLKNFGDIFNVLIAYFQSKAILKENKVDILFSKGGFVSVPVVYAAHRLHIPIITHESDITMGLATKLNSRVSNKVCLGFNSNITKKNNMYIYCGNPIRLALMKWINANTKEKEEQLTRILLKENPLFNKFYQKFISEFDLSKPIILVTGGSLGALEINNLIWNNLDELLKHFNVYHQMGKTYKKLNKKGYIGVINITDEIGFLYKSAALCISRAGASTLNELMNFNVNSLLIPLGSNASRGEQMLNAKYFEDMGCVNILREKENSSIFIDTVFNLINNRDEIQCRKERMRNLMNKDTNDRICDVILSQIGV